MMAHLVEEVVPKEYYTTMISLTADINIFLLFLAANRPKAFKHLRKTNFELPMVLVELFVTIFTSNQTTLTDIIMDMVLLEGSSTYFKAMHLYLGVVEKELLKLEDFCRRH